MPLAHPLPEAASKITAGRETLDIPGVAAIRAQAINKTDIEATMRTHNHTLAWWVSIQINANSTLTWTGDRKGASLMGWAILMAAHALKAEYRLSPQEPGTMYLESQTAAELIFDLALTAPWLNA